jgi:DNA polymerase I-like protein with 3'-5' exonuclease and polymerase domains
MKESTMNDADRHLAKDMAFVTAYGGNPVKALGLTEAEAARIVQAFGDRYPLIREAMRPVRVIFDESTRVSVEALSQRLKAFQCNS